MDFWTDRDNGTLSGCGNQKDTVHSNVNMPDSCWDTYSDTWVATDALGSDYADTRRGRKCQE